jgi:two-component system, cell cycle response regulator DivK
MPRILLIEDNPLSRDMLTRMLEKRGYNVVTAGEGSEGIAVAANQRPDVILMDMSLPGLDGWETTRELRSRPDTRGIPVIALTAHALAGDRERSLEAGCDEYETKPIELSTLVQKIENLLLRKTS